MFITRIELNKRITSKEILEIVESLVIKRKESLCICEDWFETENGFKIDVLVFNNPLEAIESQRSISIKNKYYKRILAIKELKKKLSDCNIENWNDNPIFREILDEMIIKCGMKL